MDCWVQPFSSIADSRVGDVSREGIAVLRTAQPRLAVPRDFLHDLYNAGMTSRPKKYRRPARVLAEHRLTEKRSAASKNLDRMTAAEIVRLMNREDRRVAVAVGRELPAIARAVEAIVGAIRKGGRLIYVGAGSSGRMGVLDAAECPPTFGTSPKLVQALIAGGRRAITRAVEGAEDSARSGERDDALCAGCAAICAEARGDDGGGDVKPANAAGATGENRDCAGGRAGSADGVDAAEGGNVAEDGVKHAEYGRDGAAGTRI